MVSAMRSCTVCRLGCKKYCRKPKPSSRAEAPYARARSIAGHPCKRWWTSETARSPKSFFPSVCPFPTWLLSPKKITDVYLLALAVKNSGRFVTLDSGISFQAVRIATASQLVVI